MFGDALEEHKIMLLGWAEGAALVSSNDSKDVSPGAFFNTTDGFNLNQAALMACSGRACPPFSFGPGAAVHNRIGPFPGPKSDKVTVDFNVTAIYGEDVQFLKTLGIDGNTRFDRNDGLKFGLTQAYLEFYLPVLEGTSVMVGSFQTPLENEIGYAFTPPNWFATHTYAFQHGPAKHVGVLVESRVVNSPTFGLLGVEAGIVKGWNNWTNEKGDPSFIGALRWRSVDMNTWIDLEGIYGNGDEDFGPGPGRGGSPYFASSSTGKYLGRLSTYLVVTQTLSTKLSVAFEGTYGQQMPGDVKFVPFAITEKAKWYGANVSARYALAPTVFLNARGEWFNDEKGAHALWNTARGDVFGATANVEWQLSPDVRVRGEVRYDDHTGAGRLFDNNTKNQQAVGLANIFFLF
ncbi:outer membrane beta-barrel protein [Sphingomonas sp. PP-F2F-A104-K0414]|uniref:outer membrane beta-barrel protein n=1 Tax=Sphingomonas sp. PP-F2F-A104-K0414 TaxID=2135661 RepID=UPI001404FEFA|nr:outer membrane beta-barrel protein [Sphingomonas sp. PP-F2F-A104-K0414]